MNCIKCNITIPEGKSFCPKCGHFNFNDVAKSSDDESQKIQWYFRKSFIIIAVCVVGPLALPLIWWRPQTTLAWKLGITIGILALSWILFQITLASIHSIEEYYKLLEGL